MNKVYNKHRGVYSRFTHTLVPQARACYCLTSALTLQSYGSRIIVATIYYSIERCRAILKHYCDDLHSVEFTQGHGKASACKAPCGRAKYIIVWEAMPSKD